MNRSQIMAAIKSKNTEPELLVRRLVHSIGYRYRLHQRNLPGKPDMVFASRRKVIFVHGCFWHLHGCKLSHLPKSNKGYWVPKLERNRTRDEENLAAIKKLGWQALAVWECEMANEHQLERRIRRFLK